MTILKLVHDGQKLQRQISPRALKSCQLQAQALAMCISTLCLSS